MRHHAIDRRQHTRVETALPVRCHASSQVDEAAIALDISLTGAQILINKNNSFDGPVQLEIELDSDSRIEIQAQKVWTSQLDDYNSLMGVRFEARGRQHRRLNEWLDNRCRFSEILQDYFVLVAQGM